MIWEQIGFEEEEIVRKPTDYYYYNEQLPIITPYKCKPCSRLAGIWFYNRAAPAS